MSLQNSMFRVAIAIAFAIAAGCGSNSDVGVIRGTVTADGAPVDMGTIHFRPKDDSNAKGTGGALAEGAFQLSATEEMPPGTYVVTVQASKKTGRTINDQQRGAIAEMVQLELKNSPQEIDLTAESARDLKLEFTSNRN